jgi:hypothetical protein
VLDTVSPCVTYTATQLPQIEEIEALLNGRQLQTIVFFLDETFEELTYDVTTTVLEAVEQLANLIKLQNYTTFTLFECRKMVGAKQVRWPTKPQQSTSQADVQAG